MCLCLVREWHKHTGEVTLLAAVVASRTPPTWLREAGTVFPISSSTVHIPNVQSHWRYWYREIQRGDQSLSSQTPSTTCSQTRLQEWLQWTALHRPQSSCDWSTEGNSQARKVSGTTLSWLEQQQAGPEGWHVGKLWERLTWEVACGQHCCQNGTLQREQ